MPFCIVKCLLIFSVAVLWGCSESRPPKGFEAVEPQHFDTSLQGCPELTGGYQLASAYGQNELVSDWLGIQRPEMITLVFEEWVGSSSLNYRVQMDKQAFLKQVEQLRTSLPADYYDWRTRTLEFHNNPANRFNTEIIDAIQKIGPLLQRQGQTRSYGCAAGWMKVLEKERLVQGEEGQFTRQWDLWVGRDADGNLLLKTAVYRQKPGWTFWAAGGAGVRLIPERYDWHRIAKASQDVAALTLRAEELPAVAPPQRSPDCHRNVDSLVAYNQELMQHLPADVTLTKFLPIEGAPTDACNRQVLQVGFTGGLREVSEGVLRHIKDDARVANLTTKEMRFANRQWHFLVEYTLTLD